MPFVSRPSKPVTKKVKPIDPQLLKDVDAIAAPYRQAMMALSDIVDETARQVASSSNDLTEFQARLTEEVIKSLQNAIPRISTPMTRQAFRSALEALRGLPQGLGIGISFDDSDPRAVSWARLRSGRLIVQISEEQVEMIRRIVSNAIANGVTIPQAAKQIEQVVGLHDRWQRAVENRYNNDLRRYISEGISPSRATTMATQNSAKYRQKLIRTRARNIARTEVMASQNYGTYLGWIEAGEKGLVNLSVTKKEWVAGPSGWKGISVCDLCAPYDGMKVPITSSFPNGLLTPPAHPNCRCRMILIPPEV